MIAVRNAARAVRALALAAAVIALGLAVVFVSTVPTWCDAPQHLAPEQCATTGASR